MFLSVVCPVDELEHTPGKGASKQILQGENIKVTSLHTS